MLTGNLDIKTLFGRAVGISRRERQGIATGSRGQEPVGQIVAHRLAIERPAVSGSVGVYHIGSDLIFMSGEDLEATLRHGDRDDRGSELVGINADLLGSLAS